MPLTVCILASGSSGNCTYVGAARTKILVDAGLSAREIARRLEPLGVGLSDIQAVCLTHEHDDHTTAVGTLQKRHGLALYANSGTIQGLEHKPQAEGLAWQVFTTGSPFEIGDLHLEPFAVPHDAYDPVGFIVQSGPCRVGVVTDMGVATQLIRQRLKSCNILIVESNHDPDMLVNAQRPWSLKRRIAGRHGHLSNEGAAEMIAEIAGPALSHVYLAHLSAECNRPDLALRRTRAALEKAGVMHVQVRLAYADRASEVWSAEDAGSAPPGPG